MLYPILHGTGPAIPQTKQSAMHTGIEYLSIHVVKYATHHLLHDGV